MIKYWASFSAWSALCLELVKVFETLPKWPFNFHGVSLVDSSSPVEAVYFGFFCSLFHFVIKSGPDFQHRLSLCL